MALLGGLATVLGVGLAGPAPALPANAVALATGEAQPVARTATMDAVRATLAAGCLVIDASVLLDGSPVAALRSTGSYDRLTRTATFHHLLRPDDGTDPPLAVVARHRDGWIEVWPDQGPGPGDEPPPPWVATTPQVLAEHGSARSMELARLGRYQPTVAIDLLAGIDLDTVESVDGSPDLVSVVVDLEAAVLADRRLRAAADAFPFRRVRATLDLAGHAGAMRAVEYHLDLPSGAGAVAQHGVWRVEVAEATSLDGRSTDASQFGPDDQVNC